MFKGKLNEILNGDVREFSIKPEQSKGIVEIFDLVEVPTKDYSISVDVADTSMFRVKAEVEDRIWRIFVKICSQTKGLTGIIFEKKVEGEEAKGA